MTADPIMANPECVAAIAIRAFAEDREAGVLLHRPFWVPAAGMRANQGLVPAYLPATHPKSNI